MIIILKPDSDKTSTEYTDLVAYLDNLPNITVRMHEEKGEQQRLTEFYLVGDTMPLDDAHIRISPWSKESFAYRANIESWVAIMKMSEPVILIITASDLGKTNFICLLAFVPLIHVNMLKS